MQRYELDVVVTRGSEIESRHCVHAAVVGPDDALLGAARDPKTVTFWRSCAKPFQVLPFLEGGGFDEVQWGADELALSCGSHGGEPEHVALVESMLHDVGLEEGDLACGPHEPLSTRGLKLMRDAGIFPSRLHNNCSGKHAAMLARAHTAGWTIEGYEREAHPVQRAALEKVSQWSGIPEREVGRAVDGCGVTVFSLPLEAMARAYARFATAAQRGDEAPRRVVDAMITHPFLVGGTDRFDTVVMEESDGRILAKVGAEGVHSLALLDRGIGIALKVEDGAQRAQGAAVLRLLQFLDALPEALPHRLADFYRRSVRNSRGEVVGEVRPVA